MERGRQADAWKEDYKEDPPAADGRKVMLPDTDHLWGHGGNPGWVWKCFARGHNPIFMDPWQGLYLGATEEIAPWSFTGGISKDRRDYPDWEPTRRALIAWGLGLAAGMLVGSQGLAVVTGLASGERAPAGVWWALVVASLVVYTLALVAMGAGGVLLLRDLFRARKR